MSSKYKKMIQLADKWNKADKKSIAVAFAVVLLMLLSCFLFGIHIKDVIFKYEMAIDERICAQVENSGFLTISNMLYNSDKIQSAAGSMEQLSDAELAIKSDAAIQILRTTQEQIGISSIAYTNAKGKILCFEGDDISDVDLSEYIEKYDGLSSISYFNQLNKEKITGKFIMLTPVRKDNIISGYVIGISEYSSVVANESDFIPVNHDEVIIDENSKVVALINNGELVTINETVDFFDELAAHTGQEEFDKIVLYFNECMNSSTTGTYVSNTGEEKIRYIFQPIKNTNNWCVINCIADSSIKPIIRDMLIKSIIIFAFVVLILVIACLVVVFHIRGEQKRVMNLEYLDGLTGVRNRNSFTTKAQEILKENKDLPYYISCYDIVNFRIINETYGHERSDEVIKALANASKEAFGKNEVFGRLSADVFVALVINDGEDEERISFIEEKVVQEAKKVFINHPIRIKRGYFEVTNYMESVSRMIDKSNIARKYAGLDNKNFTCKYSDNLLEDAKKTEKIESQMQAALDNGEFVPYLQAKFDMERNHVSGAEALVRWKKPDGSLVPPGDFIPLFEKNGFVEKIDFYMLEQICKYVRRMLDEGRKVYPVSVNQSRYLLNDPEYVSRVRDILLKYDIPVGLIELELTETVFFHERDRMIDIMNELKNINVNLSIDDFGSGYSSFNLLKDVPFDVLKIDRAFLSDTEQSDKGRWILREIVEMARGLGMDVICEGVETREQIEMLLSIKCKHAQGFYYARPIPIEEYIEKYNEINAG